ncbi:MAG: MoaD/ThiS family protein [Planctomycetota bacterium]|jgi:molybdopterin converting factor small subunit
MASVTIPLLLKDVTGGVRHVQVPGATLAEIIAALDQLHPGIEARVREGDRLNPTIAFTVDGKIATRGLATPVEPHSQIRLLPSFGGG